MNAPDLKIWAMPFIWRYQASGKTFAQAHMVNQKRSASVPANSTCILRATRHGFHALADIAATQCEFGHFQIQGQHHIGPCSSPPRRWQEWHRRLCQRPRECPWKSRPGARLFAEPAAQIVDVRLQSLAGILAGTLGMGKIGRQHFQRPCIKPPRASLRRSPKPCPCRCS